jgi:hypothetical protein
MKMTAFIGRPSSPFSAARRRVTISGEPLGSRARHARIPGLVRPTLGPARCEDRRLNGDETGYTRNYRRGEEETTDVVESSPFIAEPGNR